MARAHNTTRSGGSFDAATINAVWQKGKYHSGSGNDEIRLDVCGSKMRRGDYGNTQSQLGWEIDHIKPVAKDGGDEIANLEPLQWENNRRKGDTYPWNCGK